MVLRQARGFVLLQGPGEPTRAQGWLFAALGSWISFLLQEFNHSRWGIPPGELPVLAKGTKLLPWDQADCGVCCTPLPPVTAEPLKPGDS